MPRQIPRPDESPTPSPGQPLVAGIPLERGRKWQSLLRFAALSFPVLWLSLWMSLLLWRRIPLASVAALMSSIDALAWSLPSLLVVVVLYAALAPMLALPRRLLLRNGTLRIEERSRFSWEHDLAEPFSATLLYRDHREDGLLVLQAAQDEEGNAKPTCFLYGRYPLQAPRPPRAIPVSPLGFSLAEEALDRFGAYMMPDQRALHLPPLTQAIADAPGFAQAPLKLPLHHPEPPLSLGLSMLSWQADSIRASLSYPLVSLQPYRAEIGKEGHTTSVLLFCLQRDTTATRPEMDATPDREFPPFWFRVEWPRPLHIEHVPIASPEQWKATEMMVFSPCDVVLLLDQLARKGVLHAPFSLLQPSADTIPDMTSVG